MMISVIVPLYYGKKYISNILDMMLKNSEKLKNGQTLEIIFVNDSPDEAIETSCLSDIKGLKVKLYVNDKNRGIHYSRVKGLSHAKGSFVMFFDQDDKIEDNYFASQLEHIQKADVVVANGIAQYPNYEKCLYRYWIMHWTVKHIWFYAKFDCRIISPGQCLIKRSSIPVVWKENILKYNGADDYFLWLVMLSDKKRFAVNRECLYHHVYTSDNASLDHSQMYRSASEMLRKANGNIDSAMVSIIKKRMKQKGKSFLVRVVEDINKNGINS